MNSQYFSAILFSTLIVLAPASFGHARFILPSHTILSGDKVQSVSLISSISNDIFHPDRALGDNGKGNVEPQLADLFNMLQADVITPDGKTSHSASWQAFARMSVADLLIEKSGTYRISLVQPEVHMTTFKDAEGKPSRTFGLMQNIPEGATDIVKRASSSRVETFISYNQPNRASVKPVGKGLGLGGETHPNDLFTGETVNFQLFFNGKPAGEGVNAHFVLGGTRHRNQRSPIDITTDKDGKFSVEFPEAGFYIMEAEYAKKGDDNKIDMYHYGLYLTLEVFPQ